ncbi:hypothetical protein H0H92_006152 [Tricholoma furcatifolium]|nr:hypothetical protein H0H92_006152 [Tricholoma furcatifolium]
MFTATELTFVQSSRHEVCRKQNIKGVIVGGAAVMYLGGMRATRDIDMKVSRFPDFRSYPFLNVRIPYSIMRVTYTPPEGAEERSAVRLELNAPPKNNAAAMAEVDLYHRYSLEPRDPLERGIRYANAQLLLADKIRTHGDRGHWNDAKWSTDLEDIQFLVGNMFENDLSMPQELKQLYTEEVWNTTKNGLRQMDSVYGQDTIELAEMLGVSKL